MSLNYLLTYAFRNLLRHKRNLRTGLLLFACLSILCCMLNLGGTLETKLNEVTSPYRDLYNLRFWDELQYMGQPTRSSRDTGDIIVELDGTQELIFDAEAMSDYNLDYPCTHADIDALTAALNLETAQTACVTPVYRIESTPKEYRVYLDTPEESVIECYLLSGDPKAFVQLLFQMR